MLSRKIERRLGAAAVSEMVYEPSRRAPTRPDTLLSMRKVSGWTRNNRICNCPACEGSGYYPENANSVHDITCEVCLGEGTISEGELTRLYFEMVAEYRIEVAEWKRYSRMLSKIKRKLDTSEKKFLGLTTWFEDKKEGRDYGKG